MVLRCAGKIKYKDRFKRCKNKTVYRQNDFIELCSDCWGAKADQLLKIWHEWNKSDKSKTEPTLWIYNAEKII